MYCITDSASTDIIWCTYIFNDVASASHDRNEYSIRYNAIVPIQHSDFFKTWYHQTKLLEHVLRPCKTFLSKIYQTSLTTEGVARHSSIQTIFSLFFSKLLSYHFSHCFIKRYHQNSFLSTLCQHSSSIILVLCTTPSERHMSQLKIFICIDCTILPWQKSKLIIRVYSPQELVLICTKTIG